MPLYDPHTGEEFSWPKPDVVADLTTTPEYRAGIDHIALLLHLPNGGDAEFLAIYRFSGLRPITKWLYERMLRKVQQ